MRLDCGWRRQELARYAAQGELLPEGSRLAQHVACCEPCRAAWDELRHLALGLQGTLVAPCVSESFTEGVWERIAAAEKRTCSERAATPARTRSAASALVLARLVPLGTAALVAVYLALLSLQVARQDRDRPDANVSATIAKKETSVGTDRQDSPRKRERSESANGPRIRGKAAPVGRHTDTPSALAFSLLSRFHGKKSPLAPLPVPDDDLQYLNDAGQATDASGTPASADPWRRIEERVRRSVPVRDDFVTIPFPRLAGTSDGQLVAAVESYRREAAVVDDRLTREVTLEQKAEALSDLCERLRADTGIRLTTGRSVADEKLTVFCKNRPLREVMRQLSRPFGYTWLRTKAPPVPPTLGGTGGAGEYRYELVQDLRSQLVEEELRNRDRHAALLALDQEMGQYRQYFGLTPDEALARAKTAPPAERRWLERYAGTGWGPAQMYFRLSPQDVARLRAGERVTFSVGPTASEQSLPPELAQGVLQSLREARIRREGDMFVPVREPESSAGMPPAALPEVRPKATLEMTVSDLGQFTLIGGTGVNLNPTPGDGRHWLHQDELAVGISPSVRNPRNGAANARLARDASLRPQVSVAPAGHELRTSEIRGDVIISTTRRRVVTSADLLEALHRATGMPVVGDYYTRLFPASTAAVKDQSLFVALNQLCDAMRLRWSKEGNWLQFRSASYYHDRLKEVPNRLLQRWAASRKAHGALTLDDLIEIAQLADTQLDAGSMAEGARELHGLAEWDLARRPALRPHLRYLAGLTVAQRQEAVSPEGLAFTRMSLAQQQQFIALAFGRGSSQLRSLEELRGGTVRVDYVLPGHFQWRQPEDPLGGDRIQRMLQPPPVRERTREAALQATRRIDPPVPEAQITPTRLELAVIYSPGPESRFKPGGVRAAATSTLNFTVAPLTGPVPR